MSKDQSQVVVDGPVAQATATIVASLFRKNESPWDPNNPDDRKKISEALKEIYVGFYHAEAHARDLKDQGKL